MENFNYKGYRANNILKSFGQFQDIMKGGEGSKGGKIIGHTKSGKPIYDHFHHPSHKEFSTTDHIDAAQEHTKKQIEISKDAKYKNEKDDFAHEKSEEFKNHRKEQLKHAKASKKD